MSGYGPFLHSIAAGLIVLTFAGKNGSAQDTLSTAQDTLRITHPDSLSKKIFELEQSLEEIKETLSDQKQNDEFEALLKEAERLSHQEEEHKVDVSKKYFSGVRQQQGLNPNISFGMDFFGGVSTSKENSISDPSDISYGNNGFFFYERQNSRWLHLWIPLQEEKLSFRQMLTDLQLTKSIWNG